MVLKALKEQIFKFGEDCYLQILFLAIFGTSGDFGNSRFPDAALRQ
jgi:hypothetical protein